MERYVMIVQGRMMMNSLIKVLPGTKEYKPKEHSILTYAIWIATSPVLFISWLVYFREELNKHKIQIKLLAEDNRRKDSAIDSKNKKLKEYEQQQKQQESTTMEHNKKAVITGNRALLTETRTYDGDISNINNWLGGF
jgi:hypothetical protein